MLFLSCIGLACPVGYSVISASAALRAGVAAFAETGYRDANGEPIIGAMVQALPAHLRGRDRLVALIELAINGIETELRKSLPWGRMALILCTREAQRPGASLAGIATGLSWPDAADRVGPRTAHVADGAASVVQAIAQARTLLSEPDVQACLILAVDSLIDARVLSWLDRTQRLKTSERTDGVMPGEGACLAIVSREQRADVHVRVRGLGVAMESATVLNDEPFRADGMRAALQGALTEAGIAMHDVDFRLSDVAGESYAFEEVVLAQTRLMRQVRPSQPLWHPADCIGDSGAAAGLIQFAWAQQACHQGYAPGPVAALHASSAFGLRAAAVIEAKMGVRL